MRQSMYSAKRLLRSRLFAVTPLEDRTVPAVINWQGGDAMFPNNWSAPGNWVGGKLPGTGDIAKFDTNNVAVVVDTAQIVTGIELTTSWNSGFTVATSLTTTGASIWNNGTISGAGTWSNSGTVSLNGNTVTLSTATWENTGTIDHLTAGNLNCGSGAIINNMAGGVYDFHSDGDIPYAFGSEPTITNAGIIRKTGGLGDTVVRAIINNQSGTWDAQSGALHMQSDGGTHTGGTFNASTGASMDVTNGANATWKGTYTGSGAGVVYQANGTISIDAAGATFDYPTGLYQWNGGTINGAGLLTNASTGFITFASGTPTFNGATFSNAGTIIHKTSGNLNGGNASALTNETTGVYEFQSDGDIDSSFGAEQTLTNKGLFKKTGGTDVSNVKSIINNTATGMWEAQTGTLQIQSDGGTHTGGTFKAALNAVVNVNGNSNATWTGMYTASGAGIVGIGAGTITIGAAGATFNFPTGTPFGWYGGLITGGTLTNTGYIDLPATGGAPSLQGGTTVIDNAGTIRHFTASNLNYGTSATINNQATGIYEFYADSGVFFNAGAPPVFNNVGLVRKVGGTGNSYVQGQVNNQGGTWEAQTGSLSIVANGAGSTHAGGTFKASANAAVDLAGGQTATWTGMYTATGAGVVGLYNGILNVGVGGVTFNVSTPGLFQWNGGTISGGTFTNAGYMDLNGGAVNLQGVNSILQNNGTIRHFTSSNLNYGSAATINNQANGIYEFFADSGVFFNAGAPPVFNNVGLVRKVGGTGNSFVQGQVNTQGGTWEAQTGSLSIVTNGAGSTHTGGTFKASANAAVDLAGGQTATWTGMYTATGAGVVGIYNGTVNVGASGATFNVTTPGLFQWNGGSINGGTFTNAGFMDLNGAAVNLHGGSTVLQNNGTIRHLTASNLNYGTAATINNAGTYEFSNIGGVYFNAGAAPTFNNSGVVVKKAGANTAFISGIINSSAGASFNAQAGTLVLDHSGGAGTMVAAKFDTAAGTAVIVTNNNTVNWKGTFTGTGAGSVVFSSGTIVADPAGVTFNFNGSTFQWNGGSLTSGNYTNTGTMDLNGGTVSLQGAAMVFNNAGTIRHFTASNLNYGTAATFNNQATGIYEFYADSGVFFNAGASPVFNNVGLVRKVGGTGNSYVQGQVNNQGGTWEAQTGSLSIVTNAAGSTHTGGAFKASLNAAVDLVGGQTATWTGLYTATGAGVVGIYNGTVNVGMGGVTFNVTTPGLFQWNGGSIDGGTFTNAGFMDINGGAVNLHGATTELYVTGTVRHKSTSNLNYGISAKITVASTGLFDFQNDGGVFFNAGATPSFTNQGIVRKSAGAGSSPLGGAFSNLGTVEAKFGGLAIQGTVAQYDTGKLTGGTWFMGGGALSFNSHGGITTNQTTVIYSGTGSNFTNFNSVATNEGILQVIDNGLFAPPNTLTNKSTVTIDVGSTLGGAIDFVQNAGTTTVNGKLDPVGVVNVTGGTLTGTGTVVSDTNNSAGLVLSTGTGLTIDGTYTLSKTGQTSVVTMMTVTGPALLQGGSSDVQGNFIANVGIMQTGGTSNVSGALTSATGVTLAGGTLRGIGSVVGKLDNTGGTLAPGASPGQFSVVGDYTQSGTGKLDLEINGPTAISQFDRLNVVGKVTLGGGLNVTLGYPSVIGENYVVLTNDGTDTVSMTFNGIADGSKAVLGGATFRVNYNQGDGNDVVLTRLATSIESLVVDDGSAQRSRIRSFTVAFGGTVTLPMNKSDAFLLERTGPMGSGTVALNVDDVTFSTGNQTIVQLTLAPGPFNEFTSLSDGFYKLSVLGAQIIDQFGQAVDADNNGTVGGTNISTFHRLFGDANGDAQVTASDFNTFRLSYGSTGASIFDFNNDNMVTASDFNDFRIRYGITLMP